MGNFKAHGLALAWFAWSAWFAVLCSPVTGLAQDTSPASASLPAPYSAPNSAPYSTPYGECKLGFWSSNRNLDDSTNRPSALCGVIWKPKLNAEVSLGFDLHLGWQDHLSTNSTNIRVREAYLAYDISAVSLRLGRQTVAWGRADRINPTDVLSPKDFTLLSFDDEGQRMGIDAMKLRYALNPSFSASLLTARFAAHVTPRGALPSNLIEPDPPNRPEWAVKLDHSGLGVDWSVSAFDGFDRFTRYRLDLQNPAAPVFRGDFERVRSIGADFATAQGAWTWRGEVSHSQRRPGCNVCAHYQRSVSAALVGADLDFADTMNVNLQLFTSHRSGFAAASGTGGLLQMLESGLNRLNREYGRQDYGITLRLSDRLLNDRLKWEISAVLDLTHKSHLIRPRVMWALNDRTKLSAGFDFYAGTAQSPFGALRRNQLGFITLGLVF